MKSRRFFGLGRGLFLLCFVLLAFGWYSPSKSKRALRLLENGNLQACEKLLKSILKKDTLAPSAYYVYARLVAEARYEGYDLKRSYSLLQRAKRQWPLLDKKRRRKEENAFFNLAVFDGYEKRLDDLAYQQARKSKSISALEAFVRLHVRAAMRNQALALRDSLAFAKAATLNTPAAYRSFAEQYPSATEQTQALARYETLSYQACMQQVSMKCIEDFLSAFDSSRYRYALEYQMLELLSLDAKPTGLLHFLHKYPQSKHGDKAFALLSTLDARFDKGKYEDQYPSAFRQAADSAKQAQQPRTLFAIQRPNDQHQLICPKRRKTYDKSYDSLPVSYHEEGLNHFFVESIENGKTYLYNIQKKRFSSHPLTLIELLSPELAIVREGKHEGLLHAHLGWLIAPRFEKLTYLPEARMVRVTYRSRMGLLSLLGHTILPAIYAQIEEEGPFIFLTTSAHRLVVTHARALLDAKQQSTYPNAPFETLNAEIAERIEDNYVLIKDETGQYAIYDDSLSLVYAPAGLQPQWLAGHWLIEREDDSFLLLNAADSLSPTLLRDVELSTHWLSCRKQNSTGQQLAQLPFAQENNDLGIRWWEGENFDSLSLVGRHLARGVQGNLVRLFLPKQAPFAIPWGTKVYALPPPQEDPGMDTRFYRLRTASGADSLISLDGLRTDLSAYTEVIPLNETYLIVGDKKGNHGLINREGELVVPMDRHFIGLGDEKGMVLLLKKGRYGLFHMATKMYLKEIYDAPPTPWRENTWKLKRKGKTGVINTWKKTIIPFTQQKIEPWNDRYYLVQKADRWYVQPYLKGKERLGPFLSCLKVDKGHATALIVEQAENKAVYWGMLSQEGTWLVVPQYSFLKLLGEKEEEAAAWVLGTRYLSDAKLYLSIYFSFEGEPVYRNTTEHLPLAHRLKEKP